MTTAPDSLATGETMAAMAACLKHDSAFLTSVPQSPSASDSAVSSATPRAHKRRKQARDLDLSDSDTPSSTTPRSRKRVRAYARHAYSSSNNTRERIDLHRRGYMPPGESRPITCKPDDVSPSTWSDGSVLLMAELMQPGFAERYPRIGRAIREARRLREERIQQNNANGNGDGSLGSAKSAAALMASVLAATAKKHEAAVQTSTVDMVVEPGDRVLYPSWSELSTRRNASVSAALGSAKCLVSSTLQDDETEVPHRSPKLPILGHEYVSVSESGHVPSADVSECGSTSMHPTECLVSLQDELDDMMRLDMDQMSSQAASSSKQMAELTGASLATNGVCLVSERDDSMIFDDVPKLWPSALTALTSSMWE